MEKEKKRKEKKEKKMEIKMEDKQSGEQQHRSRTKPPAAAPASSHSTKRKTPAVGGDAQEAGDSFTELVEKAEAVTAFLTSMIQGSPAKSNAGKRELESPSPAQVKRLKSETVHAEADVDVLPGGLLAKVPLKTTAVCRSSQGHVCFWCMMLLVMRLRRLRQGRRLLASMAPLEHGGRNAVPRRTSK